MLHMRSVPRRMHFRTRPCLATGTERSGSRSHSYYPDLLWIFGVPNRTGMPASKTGPLTCSMLPRSYRWCVEAYRNALLRLFRSGTESSGHSELRSASLLPNRESSEASESGSRTCSEERIRLHRQLSASYLLHAPYGDRREPLKRDWLSPHRPI